MKKDYKELLWHILKATTNSKNDIWREIHLERHCKLPKRMLGTPKRRFTIPVVSLGATANSEATFLLMQFCSTKPEEEFIRYFTIGKSAFNVDLKNEIEYVYLANIRIGDINEFIRDGDHNIVDYGELKKNSRASILATVLKMIEGTPRNKLVKSIPKKVYNKMNKKQWDNLIVVDQFTLKERSYKGIKDKKK